MHARHTSHSVHGEARYNLQGSLLLFHHVDPVGQTQVARLGSLYPLSYLAGWFLVF